MEPRSKARLDLLLAALLFSTGGAAIKACALTGWQVACFRSGLGALALLCFLPGARRGWSRRTWIVACAYAATLILYVLANKLTTAANAIFLQSTAPLYLLLISPWLLKESIRKRDLGFMLALACGLAMFFVGMEAPQETAPDPFLGNLLGAAAAVTWAFTVAGMRWLARTEGGGRDAARHAAGAAVAGNLLVFAVALPFALPVESAVLSDWAWIGYLGTLQIGLAYVFMTAGMRRIHALEGALLLLVEPVLNTVWAFALHGEVPATWSIVGAAVILVATALHALAGSESRRRSAVDPYP